jgi:hypothetical protein
MGGAAFFQFGRFLVIAGVFVVGLGLILMAGSRFSFWGLGRLPGDMVFKGKNFQFYFPVTTCIVVSIVATLVFWVIRLLTRR